MQTNIIWFCSIDIGKKNFAFCIEEFDRQELLGIKNIPFPKRYHADGTPTDEMNKILDKIYRNGKIILYKVLDLTENCDPKQKLDPETFHNMIDVLDKYKDYWDKCLGFVIEEQMSFGKKLNKMAVKLGQHCYSYFTFLYGRHKQVIEFPAYHKTQVLGAEKVEGNPTKKGKIRFKAVDKTTRKKWAVQKALEILTTREETDVVNNIKKMKKKDDICDTICQLNAAKYKLFVDKCL